MLHMGFTDARCTFIFANQQGPFWECVSASVGEQKREHLSPHMSPNGAALAALIEISDLAMLEQTMFCPCFLGLQGHWFFLDRGEVVRYKDLWVPPL